MSLLDHFHPPLSEDYFWHPFHNMWAGRLAAALNARLPDGYFAAPNVHFAIEIDVATFRRSAAPPAPPGDWVPPAARRNVSVSLAQPLVEVTVFSRSGGPQLIGTIELVSPANKDRPAHRDAFTSKCAAYIQNGIGLVVVDVVTERAADFHGDLLTRLRAPAEEPVAPLYAAAYRPIEQDGTTTLDIWHEPLAVGRPLPTMPLWLRGDLCLPVELQATYERTCHELKVTAPAA